MKERVQLNFEALKQEGDTEAGINDIFEIRYSKN